MNAPALRTPLCDRLGIEFPIVQAPIGRVSSPELAAAVSQAGGLGMLGASYLDPGEIAARVQSIRALTDRPFGLNLILVWDQRERLAACLEAGVRILSYHWAHLSAGSPYVKDAHAAGALVMLTVGSSDDAKRAVDAGVDIVVAQGVEAGGHVWGSVGTLALVPSVVDRVAPVPVIAAGGIGDGRGVAAVLALGAQAAMLGTRFVVADESAGHPEYRDRIVSARESDAVLSVGVFDTEWPGAPVRALDNTTLRDWRQAGSAAPGSRPGEGEVVGRRDDGVPILRYSTAPPMHGASGALEAMANYAGQSAGVVTRRQPAAEIVREVAAEAERTCIRLIEETAERMEAERRVAREIGIAREVQGRLFPQTVPRSASVEFSARCVQARSVGGDYYDFLDLGPRHVGFVLADVSGKGVHAALRMANLQAHLRSQAGIAPQDPLRALRQVNRMLWESTDASQFATLFFGIYTDASRRLTYINCGHNPPLCLRRDGGVERLEPTATVIGAFEDWECSLGRTHLAAGDLLVAYSDGITEASRGPDEFGESRLLEVLRGHAESTPEEVISAVLDSVQDFSHGAQLDDLTILVARGRS